MNDHSDLIERLRALPTMEGSWVDTVRNEAVEALSSQSLSLSKARAENDRKDLEIERLRADIAVKAKLLTKSAKETRAFWDALIPKGGRCRDCADFDGRCQGDGPPCDPQAHSLENLAKLQAASPDISSLRKGAEELDAALLESTAMRHSTGEHYSVEVFFTSFDGSERFRALLSARCARIRSALVSGGREDGDG